MVTTSRLRTDFIRRAAERVENMIAYQADEVVTAVEELRRYFEWVKDGICPEERLQISQRISGLSTKTKAVGRKA
jgi:hypothetical protein